MAEGGPSDDEIDAIKKLLTDREEALREIDDIWTKAELMRQEEETKRIIEILLSPDEQLERQTEQWERQNGMPIYDPETLEQYELAIKEGRAEENTIRLMIIGCHGQGKTTLARRLLGQALDGIESTNGVDIHKAVCSHGGCKWEHRKKDDIQTETMKRLARISLAEKRDSKINEENASSEGPAGALLSSVDLVHGNTATHLPLVNIKKQRYLRLFEQCKQSAKHEQDQEISLWDFGGQFVFYATHQLFHSRHAVYLLVFDLHKSLDTVVRDDDYPDNTNISLKSMKDYIEFWVTSVHSYVGNTNATNPKIILVGTHKDELEQDSKADEYFKSVRKLFVGRKMKNHIYHESFPIATTDFSDDTVEKLRETILNIGRKRKQILPARWLLLAQGLKEKQNEEIMKFTQVIEINKSMEHPLHSDDEIKAFLKFYHATGAFIYFDEGEMAQYVIINPPYIINAFKRIITSGKFCKTENPLWQRLINEAILEENFINTAWENDANDGDESNFIEFKTVLMSVLQKQKIIAKAHTFDEKSEQFTPLDYYIVPSFLRTPMKKDIENFLVGRNCTVVSLVYVFDNEAIVPTIFHRVTAAAVGSFQVIEFDESNLLFENAGVYKLKLNYGGIIIRDKSTIELLVVHLSQGEKISAEIPGLLRRFAENVFRTEFSKLNDPDDDPPIAQPFKIAVRCQNRYHNGEGSRKRYELEMLKSQQERTVCCPDYAKHESISIEDMLHEWFNGKVTEKEIPKRTLSSQEYCHLSEAFGKGWQNLGLYLGVSYVTIQQIEMDKDTTQLRIYEMLKKWETLKADEATLNVLVEAIEKLPKESVNFDTVNNIIDGVYL